MRRPRVPQCGECGDVGLRFIASRASRRYGVLSSLARLRDELYARQAKRARLAYDDAAEQEDEDEDEEEEEDGEEEEADCCGASSAIPRGAAERTLPQDRISL